MRYEARLEAAQTVLSPDGKTVLVESGELLPTGSELAAGNAAAFRLVVVKVDDPPPAVESPAVKSPASADKSKSSQ